VEAKPEVDVFAPEVHVAHVQATMNNTIISVAKGNGTAKQPSRDIRVKFLWSAVSIDYSASLLT
jgi:ribosomal protein S11